MPTLPDVVSRGPSPETAPLTLIMIHGRGASAESILSLYEPLALPMIAALAPEAPGGTWYPYSFLAPIEQNQPQLARALGTIQALVEDLLRRGVASSRIALLGFSQGACLACEFIARNPRRYAGLIAFTGGLIGPPGTVFNYPGSLEKTPVFLGTSDPDPHVPYARVEETQATFRGMHATVELRRYPGMPHTVNEEEVEAARGLLEGAMKGGSGRWGSGGRG